MEFNGFTEKANIALNNAMRIAMEFGHTYVGSEHILYGLLTQDSGVAWLVLDKHGVTQKEIANKMEILVGKGIPTKLTAADFTPRSKRILETALTQARAGHHSFVGTEHILRAMIKDSECYATIFLKEMGVNITLLYSDCGDNGITRSKQDTTDDTMNYNSYPHNTATETKTRSTLLKYGRDLTKMAKENKIDPVIQRSEEISRVIQILLRRTKNNPCLIGEPGVGKTAVAEGLALKIAEGQVPENIKNKRVFILDLTSMLAGAKYRGDFEERIKNAMDEIIKDGNIILFIDEIHNIIGAGAAEGAIDAANILKPILARGELQLIGATTLEEYRKFIEKDSALERRFQPIVVKEPSEEDALKILYGLRDKYEAHHRVKISDEALQTAVQLSTRYITDRFLPDKAIDLVDEAASKLRLKSFTAPPKMQEIDERLRRLQDEKATAIHIQDFEQAAKLRDVEKKLLLQLEISKKQWNLNGEHYGEVTGENIAEIVSKWTGIPVSKVTEGETKRLIELEKTLSESVIGQEEAVAAISRAIRRGRAGLKDPKRPIGSFIFLGPTGVGKTQLCKSLAENLFGDENAMLKFDMSEYMEKHSVSKLIGSPPGYVGFDEGGQLTEKIRRKPYSVVLFDEIEKAHADVYNLLLQILEDGVLTNSNGRTVDFKNAVIIMTSNIGAKIITDKKVNLGFGENEEIQPEKSQIMKELKQSFKPEFLNRVDDIIIFRKLNEENITEICRNMLTQLAKRVEKLGVKLEFTNSAVKQLVKIGFDSAYGARPLRRAITANVEDLLSQELLEKKYSKGDYIVIDFAENPSQQMEFLTYSKGSQLLSGS